MGKFLDNDYICYDITSVSSYSELNEFIKWGHNRDNEKLPQLNLAMLFGQKSALPVYYHLALILGTRLATLTMVFKLAYEAQKRWKRIKG